MFDFLPPIWNGTLREHYVVLFAAAGSFALVAGLVGAWLGARFGSRRVVQDVLDRLPGREAHDLTTRQLVELAQAMDVIGVEVERLSEGQRYAARLLTERANAKFPAPADRPPGVITPH